eukprot:Skav203755  [mRNA]  locus=scaffold68:638937:644165:+ [translate_table: standard]
MFQEPSDTPWKQLFKKAQYLSEAGCEALWRDQVDPGNTARNDAIKQLEGFIDAASTARSKAFHWHGGAQRIDAMESARQWVEELTEGSQLNLEELKKSLAKQHFQVVSSRTKMRSSDAEFQNQLELESQGGVKTLD